MTRIYLSLGSNLESNLGSRADHLRLAVGKLSSLGTVTRESAVYETEPVEFTEQPEFLNCVVELETALSAEALLAGILAIERAMGRDRAAQVAKGPRVIDIDILLFGDAVMNSPELVIPHPAMHLRRFVLEPLTEIAGGIQHPVLHRTMEELLAELPQGQVVCKLPPSNV